MKSSHISFYHKILVLSEFWLNHKRLFHILHFSDLSVLNPLSVNPSPLLPIDTWRHATPDFSLSNIRMSFFLDRQTVASVRRWSADDSDGVGDERTRRRNEEDLDHSVSNLLQQRQRRLVFLQGIFSPGRQSGSFLCIIVLLQLLHFNKSYCVSMFCILLSLVVCFFILLYNNGYVSNKLL